MITPIKNVQISHANELSLFFPIQFVKLSVLSIVDRVNQHQLALFKLRYCNKHPTSILDTINKKNYYDIKLRIPRTM